MSKLKLGPLADEKPVKLTIDLTAAVHRDLVAYANLLGQNTGQTVSDPAKLIGPMIERFMATDRGFAKAKREGEQRPSHAPVHTSGTAADEEQRSR